MSADCHWLCHGRNALEHPPDLIASCSRHISHPFDAPVAALFKDLQISHQQPTARKHQKTKAQTQRWSTPRFLVRHACQLRLCREHIFALTSKPRDLPHDIILLGLVLCFSIGGSLGDFSGVERCRDANNDIGSKKL